MWKVQKVGSSFCHEILSEPPGIGHTLQKNLPIVIELMTAWSIYQIQYNNGIVFHCTIDFTVVPIHKTRQDEDCRVDSVETPFWKFVKKPALLPSPTNGYRSGRKKILDCLERLLLISCSDLPTKYEN
jgi:hypothetical protein